MAAQPKQQKQQDQENPLNDLFNNDPQLQGIMKQLVQLFLFSKLAPLMQQFNSPQAKQSLGVYGNGITAGLAGVMNGVLQNMLGAGNVNELRENKANPAEWQRAAEGQGEADRQAAMLQRQNDMSPNRTGIFTPEMAAVLRENTPEYAQQNFYNHLPAQFKNTPTSASTASTWLPNSLQGTTMTPGQQTWFEANRANILQNKPTTSDNLSPQ